MNIFNNNNNKNNNRPAANIFNNAGNTNATGNNAGQPAPNNIFGNRKILLI